MLCHCYRNTWIICLEDGLTISTTSTSASSRSWYKNIFKSFFIWMELSSICATVKMRILQFFQVRCCFSRNGSSISMPPSCTIHQMSMLPVTYDTVLICFNFLHDEKLAPVCKAWRRKNKWTHSICFFVKGGELRSGYVETKKLSSPGKLLHCQLPRLLLVFILEWRYVEVQGKDLTFSEESGKKLMPLGTSMAMRAAVTARTVCRKECHLGRPSAWYSSERRQP